MVVFIHSHILENVAKGMPLQMAQAELHLEMEVQQKWVDFSWQVEYQV